MARRTNRDWSSDASMTELENVTVKPWKGTAPLAWVAAVAFSFAALWPHYSTSALPLVGLRNLVDPLIGRPLAVVTFAMALLLSFRSFLTKERLLISAGFSFCLFVVTAFYASPVAAVVFLLIGANLVRETRSPNRTSQAEVTG
jgi:hypothetical protein